MTEPTTLADIERLTKTYADRRARLAELMTALNDELLAAKRRHLAGIKRQLGLTADAQQHLAAGLDDAQHLFVKPRTLIIHGVKVGYAKGSGSIEIADQARTVALIRRHLPELAETLIRVSEQPIKPALAALSVADLKRVGCVVTDTGDRVVIKAVDGEVDKMVDALLKDAADTTSTTEEVGA